MDGHGDVLMGIVAAWFAIGWLPGLLVLYSTRGGNENQAGRWWWLETLLFSAWAGPFVIAAVVALVVWLVRNPPLRREWEHVPDLREADRD